MPSRRSSTANKRSRSSRKDNVMPFEKRSAPKPKPPFPKQHQPHPGIEQEIEPRPQYHAPLYKGAGKLADKVALITGGDSGIGRAVAVLYAREGANIALIFLPEEERDARETAQAVEHEGQNCILIPGDVSDPGFCRKAVEKTVGKFGSWTFWSTMQPFSNIRSPWRR